MVYFSSGAYRAGFGWIVTKRSRRVWALPVARGRSFAYWSEKIAPRGLFGLRGVSVYSGACRYLGKFLVNFRTPYLRARRSCQVVINRRCPYKLDRDRHPLFPRSMVPVRLRRVMSTPRLHHTPTFLPPVAIANRLFCVCSIARSTSLLGPQATSRFFSAPR